MSSTLTLDRQARQASPDPLASDAAPAPLPSTPLPLEPFAVPTPGSEAALAPASGSTPALATILFDDISIPSTPPADGTEALAPAPFMIDDLSKASWAAATALEAEARIAERATLAASYKARIDAWLSDSNTQDECTAAYMSMLLKPYIESELARSGSRSRTVKLITASASLRKAPDHFSVLDEAVAMAYL